MFQTTNQSSNMVLELNEKEGFRWISWQWKPNRWRTLSEIAVVTALAKGMASRCPSVPGLGRIYWIYWLLSSWGSSEIGANSLHLEPSPWIPWTIHIKRPFQEKSSYHHPIPRLSKYSGIFPRLTSNQSTTSTMKSVDHCHKGFTLNLWSIQPIRCVCILLIEKQISPKQKWVMRVSIWSPHI